MQMVGAFISHSKKDVGIVNKIYKALYQAGVRPKLAEFEELGKGKLTAHKIKKMIASSSWTLVFLTPNVIARTHTRDWVAYEVGVSHGLNKPVWVFEDEKYQIKKFLVPYLNYYLLYNSRKRKDWHAIKEEIKKQRKFSELGPKIAGAMLGGPFGRIRKLSNASPVPAKPASERELGFFLHSEFLKVAFSCPSCNSKYTILGRYGKLMSGYTCPICRDIVKIEIRSLEIWDPEDPYYKMMA